MSADGEELPAVRIRRPRQQGRSTAPSSVELGPIEVGRNVRRLSWFTTEDLAAELLRRALQDPEPELTERAKSLTVHTVVRDWLGRHSRSLPAPGPERDRELDWLASNFLADPEIAVHLVVAEAPGGEAPDAATPEDEAAAARSWQQSKGSVTFGEHDPFCDGWDAALAARAVPPAQPTTADRDRLRDEAGERR